MLEAPLSISMSPSFSKDFNERCSTPQFLKLKSSFIFTINRSSCFCSAPPEVVGIFSRSLKLYRKTFTLSKLSLSFRLLVFKLRGLISFFFFFPPVNIKEVPLLLHNSQHFLFSWVFSPPLSSLLCFFFFLICTPVAL